MFYRNAWYVAERSHEIGQELRALTILGEEIVLFRRADGSPAALEDACPHRKLPLSMGSLKGDTVQCGYHGLTFDGDGQCVAAPTQPGQIPKRARVRSYPVCDRYDLLWIWMGDPAAADADTIYRIDAYDDPDWGRTEGGVLDFACNYLWIADNLLDPSHVAWVHPTSFAGSGTDGTPLSVTEHEHGVVVSRWIAGEAPSPYYAGLLAFEGNCDRLQHYEMVYPSIGVNKSVFAPAGAGGDGCAADPRTFINVSYNFLTPVDEDRTRYFWFQHRNQHGDDRSVSRSMNEGARPAFLEDKAVLERVHQGMKRAGGDSLNLTLDAGPQMFRRGLSRRIEAASGTGA